MTQDPFVEHARAQIRGQNTGSHGGGAIGSQVPLELEDALELEEALLLEEALELDELLLLDAPPLDELLLDELLLDAPLLAALLLPLLDAETLCPVPAPPSPPSPPAPVDSSVISFNPVALLANVDVGWLQNPLYYPEAQNRAIIRWLPAYSPSQIAMASAFTEHSIARAVWASLAYGSALLLVAVPLFHRRTRVRR